MQPPSPVSSALTRAASKTEKVRRADVAGVGGGDVEAGAGWGVGVAVAEVVGEDVEAVPEVVGGGAEVEGAAYCWSGLVGGGGCGRWWMVLAVGGLVVGVSAVDGIAVGMSAVDGILVDVFVVGGTLVDLPMVDDILIDSAAREALCRRVVDGLRVPSRALALLRRRCWAALGNEEMERKGEGPIYIYGVFIFNSDSSYPVTS